MNERPPQPERGDYLDQVDRIRVTAQSPDGTVRVRCDRGDGIRVAFADDVENKHTEESLARQITLAVRRVADGQSAALATVHRRRWGSEPTPPESEAGLDRLRTLGRKLADIEVRALGPRGYVQVAHTGQRGLDVRIEPGALRRAGVTGGQVATEVNLALARAGRDWARRWSAARVDAAAV